MNVGRAIMITPTRDTTGTNGQYGSNRRQRGRTSGNRLASTEMLLEQSGSEQRSDCRREESERGGVVECQVSQGLVHPRQAKEPKELEKLESQS